jgi:thymidylate synthase (FAD)
VEVELISAPMVFRASLRKMGFTEPPDDCSDADLLGEVAGRVCYASWNRPNPATATNSGYLANILKQQHYSVLEHAQFVFWLRGASRAFTHELVRHRHLQYSQRSQRYVDERFGEFIEPPEISLHDGLQVDDVDIKLVLSDAHQKALDLYEQLVQTLTAAGVPRKRARQAARYVLPSGHSSELIFSGNLNAWRTMLVKRMAVNEHNEPLADLEFFMLAQDVLHQLYCEAPNSMQDLWLRYTSWLRTGPREELVLPRFRGDRPMLAD